MINDPVVYVVCDRCGDDIEVSLDYKFTDHSGNNGYYDTSDKAICDTIKIDGWFADEYNQLCPDCGNQKNLDNE